MACDLPGFGLSGDLPVHRRTLDGYAESVALLVEELDLADAVVVVHEAGALIAAGAGRRLLERDARESGEGGASGRRSFAGAVVVAASPFSTDSDTPPPSLHRFGALPRLRDAVFAATGRPRLALDALQSQRSRFTASAAGVYAWPLRTASRRRAMVDLAALAADRGARSVAAAWLLDFPGPVALVWGHRDPLMGAEDFAALERELPYARIWRTEAGHFVQEEAPDAIVEAIEWTAQRLGTAADPEGIPANFLPGIGSGDYVEVGRSQVRRLIEHAGLEPSDRILDVGCGLGRTARALRETMSPAGRYDGVDVVRDVVRWCQQNLTRVDRRLRFHHAAVRSVLYSPHGSIDARQYRFPFEDESFDFVIAESLFTHLAAEEARSYLAEIGRVMRPGATLCVCVPARPSRARGDRRRDEATTASPPRAARVDRGSRATAARGRVRRRLVHARARWRGARARAAGRCGCLARRGRHRVVPGHRGRDQAALTVSLGAERTAKLGALLRVEAAAPGALTAIGPTENGSAEKTGMEQDPGQADQADGLPERDHSQSEELGHQPVPQVENGLPESGDGDQQEHRDFGDNGGRTMHDEFLKRFGVHRRRPGASFVAAGRRTASATAEC